MTSVAGFALTSNKSKPGVCNTRLHERSKPMPSHELPTLAERAGESTSRHQKTIAKRREALALATAELDTTRKSMGASLEAAQAKFESSGSPEDAGTLALQERTSDLTVTRAERAQKTVAKALRDAEAAYTAELAGLRQGWRDSAASRFAVETMADFEVSLLEDAVASIAAGGESTVEVVRGAIARKVGSKLASIRQWIEYEDACKTARAAELGPREEIVRRFARELERRLPREIPPIDPSHSVTFGSDALARMHPSEREKAEALRRQAQANFDRWAKRIEGIRAKIERDRDAALVAYDAEPLANPPTPPASPRPERLDAWRLVLSPEPAAPPLAQTRQIPSDWSPGEVLARQAARWTPDEVAE